MKRFLHIAALALALAPGLAWAQPNVAGTFKNFKVVPERYPAPNAEQMKSLLEGAEAQPQPDRRVLVKGAKLQTFLPDGKREMLVETPACLYDPAARSASSGTEMRAQTADGKFLLEGEGFLWQQTNSSLFISNRVYTLVHADLLQSPKAESQTNAGAASAAGIKIFSDRFYYGGDTSLGVYEGNVRVQGTNLNLTGGLLRFKMPMQQRQLQELTAEENVVLDYAGTHATGTQAVYSAESGLVQVHGQPSWEAEQLAGRANELLIDPTNKVFRAIGQAWLRLPGHALGKAGLLGAANAANAPVPTNRFVEVTCDNYERRTNWAVFRGNVRVRELAGDQLLGKLSCAVLTLTLSETNELQTLVADDQVEIEQAESNLGGGKAVFTGGKAVYAATNAVLELTENPRWQAGMREGRGDVIKANVQHNEIMVLGNASMRFPAAELGQVAPAAPNSPKPVNAGGATNQFADVFAEEYLAAPQAALFLGNVRIQHPQMSWTCERIAVQSRPGGAVDRMTAEQKVVFRWVDARGQAFDGRGDNAVYTYSVSGTVTNDLVRLTGAPATITTTNGVVQNTVIILDRAKTRVIAAGKYLVGGSGPPGGTNQFEVLQEKKQKKKKRSGK